MSELLQLIYCSICMFSHYLANYIPSTFLYTQQCEHAKAYNTTLHTLRPYLTVHSFSYCFLIIVHTSRKMSNSQRSARIEHMLLPADRQTDRQTDRVSHKIKY